MGGMLLPPRKKDEDLSPRGGRRLEPRTPNVVSWQALPSPLGSNGLRLARSGQRAVHPSDWTLASKTCRRAGRGQPLRQHRGQAGRGYGGASYPAPLSLAAVVVPTAGRAATPPVPLSAAQYSPSCPRSSRTAGQENGGKGVGPAGRGRRGKGGGEWTRMRPRAETAPCPPGRP